MIQAKFIDGYDYDYMVCSNGKIISFKRKKLVIMKPSYDKYGYPHLDLRQNSKGKKHTVHRLVAGAFLPNFSEDLQVDHIDRNKANNDISNLRMCTGVENQRNKMISNKNKSGVPNLFWDEIAKKWKVSFTTTNDTGEQYYLFYQSFSEDQFEQACKCAQEMRKKLYGEYA